MTDSKQYTVRGAEVIITVNLYPKTISIHTAVDLSELDKDEPDHSAHTLITYLHPLLPSYATRESYWWCKLFGERRCKTGAQAKRVIKATLDRLDDAIQAALIARDARKAHMRDIFPTQS